MWRAVEADWRTAPIGEGLRATLGFVETMTLRPEELTTEDADRVRRAGVSDEALVDAIHVAALFNTIRSMCVPYPFGPGRSGAGLPRLHGLERVLQPSPERREFAPAVSSVPLGAGIGSSMVDPLYVQTSLVGVGQAWPVQALLESLRRQYGPV